MGTHETDETRRLRQAADHLRRQASETELAIYQEKMRKAAEDLEARAQEIERASALSASGQAS